MKGLDMINLGDGYYVLISENRINFLSGISEEDIQNTIREEEMVVNSCVSTEDIESEEISIAFVPTLDCNLRCIYCYARGGDNKVYMDPKIAENAINAVRKLKKDSNQITLLIYFVGGGEPFLNFRCMKHVYEYARKCFDKTEIILVSNGTFGEEELQWLIQNKATVRISYDGVCHSAQRPFASGKSSRDIVRANISKLVEAKIPLTIQLTISSQSVEVMTESVEDIANLGVKYVKIEPVHYSVISRGNKDLVPNPDLLISNFIETVNLILRKGIDIKIDNSFISRPTSGYYCGAGEGSNKIITPTGDITACLEICRKKDKYSDIMIYGKCDSVGFNIEKSKREFLDKLHFKNYQNCNVCNLKLICGGGCPMQRGWDNNNLFIPSDYNCYIYKTLLPNLFRMIFDNNKIVDVIFDNHSVSMKC